jgi:hypothetical protein
MREPQQSSHHNAMRKPSVTTPAGSAASAASSSSWLQAKARHDRGRPSDRGDLAVSGVGGSSLSDPAHWRERPGRVPHATHTANSAWRSARQHSIRLDSHALLCRATGESWQILHRRPNTSKSYIRLWMILCFILKYLSNSISYAMP